MSRSCAQCGRPLGWLDGSVRREVEGRKAVLCHLCAAGAAGGASPGAPRDAEGSRSPFRLDESRTTDVEAPARPAGKRTTNAAGQPAPSARMPPMGNVWLALIAASVSAAIFIPAIVCQLRSRRPVAAPAESAATTSAQQTPARWIDGGPFVCGAGDRVEFVGKKVTDGMVRAEGDCRLTLSSCELTGRSMSVLAKDDAHVEIRGGTIQGDVWVPVRAEQNAVVELVRVEVRSARSGRGAIEVRDAATLRVVGGVISSDADVAIRAAGTATVVVTDAVLQGGEHYVVSAGGNARVELVRARVASPRAGHAPVWPRFSAIDASGQARIGVDGGSVKSRGRAVAAGNSALVVLRDVVVEAERDSSERNEPVALVLRESAVAHVIRGELRAPKLAVEAHGTALVVLEAAQLRGTSETHESAVVRSRPAPGGSESHSLAELLVALEPLARERKLLAER